METKFNFKSAICTDINQSKRLLALGLKKETADMCLTNDVVCPFTCPDDDRFIPAWSLGRLIKDLMPQIIGYLELAIGGEYVGYYKDEYDGMEWEYASVTPDMFDNIISTIEWLIKEGYFNKEYLV